MFVLMVAVAPPLLSDQPPEVPRRAGLGDRFHYFRGVSGRRYLFTEVALGDLRDFHSAVVMLARRQADGRLAAFSVSVSVSHVPAEPAGRAHMGMPPAHTVALVHLLAGSEALRRDLIADLSPPLTVALAA
jgi:hypothetical protein